MKANGNPRKMNIGIFDSGLGGLSILKEVMKILPEYNYIYLGDNARVPYGGRSQEMIYQFTKNAVDFLMKKNCSLVILACNTATSAALRKIQQEYLPKNYPKNRVLGVIRPAVEAIKDLNVKSIGVMGTYGTISSRSFVTEIAKLSPEARIYQQACPLLVPIIEEGKFEWKGLDLILEEYLSSFKKEQIEGLILGCTHYGLIENKISKIMGRKVKIVSEGREVALRLKDYLERHIDIENRLAKHSHRTFYVTDLNQRYQNLVGLFLEKHLSKSHKLNLVNI